MVKQIQGTLQGSDEKYAIVVSRFNEFITSRLLDGAIDCLKRHGVKEANITSAWVPGAFEVPLAADKLAQTGKFDAVICLATVIRGQTSHYDHVCQQITRGVGEVGLKTGVPTIFGVITCDNLEQAVDRAGTKDGNNGAKAALSALEMVRLVEEIEKL